MKSLVAAIANNVFQFHRKPSISELRKEIDQELLAAELQYYHSLQPLLDNEKLHQFASFLASRYCGVFEGKCWIEPNAGQVLYGRLKQYINNAFNPYELADPLAYIPAKPLVTNLLSAKKVGLKQALYLRDGWHNLYHFYFDVLGQLLLAKEWLPAGIPIVVPYDYAKMPFVNIVLQRLNLHRLNFFPQPLDTVIMVKQQLYILKDKVLNQSVINSLRNAFPLVSNQQHAVNIFVSRTQRSTRSLQNEVQVKEAMSNAAINTIYAENYSYVEQVNFFSSASVLIGLHGAGLANIVFMPEGSRLIECIPQGYFRNNLAIHYQRLAHFLGLDYQVVEGGALNEKLQYELSPEVANLANTK